MFDFLFRPVFAVVEKDPFPAFWNQQGAGLPVRLFRRSEETAALFGFFAGKPEQGFTRVQQGARIGSFSQLPAGVADDQDLVLFFFDFVFRGHRDAPRRRGAPGRRSERQAKAFDRPAARRDRFGHHFPATGIGVAGQRPAAGRRRPRLAGSLLRRGAEEAERRRSQRGLDGEFAAPLGAGAGGPEPADDHRQRRGEPGEDCAAKELRPHFDPPCPTAFAWRSSLVGHCFGSSGRRRLCRPRTIV